MQLSVIGAGAPCRRRRLKKISAVGECAPMTQMLQDLVFGQ
jgi:hypothetical protein